MNNQYSSNYIVVQIIIIPYAAPELTSFSMDLDSGVLMLSFNKPLRIATFNPTITLQNTGKAPTASLQLSSHLVHTSTDSSVVSLSLNQDDLNTLKSTTSLYTSIANSFLSFTSRNTVGVEGVPLLAISMENGTAANALIPDNTSPAVVRIATFDLDAGTFDIVFDEPVNPLTLDVTRILLQDMQSNPTATYMLIGGTAMTLGTPTTIRLIMTTQDRNEVNRLGTLAVDASSTWIAFTSNAIQDFSGNTNIPGIIGAVNFIPDTTPASLRCFTLDMNAAVLGLSFDDLVTQSSFNGNKVRLQSSPSSTTVYKLAAAPMPAGMSDYLEVFIAQDIFNRLQSDANIATMQNNTYLSATQGFVSDIYSRPASGIPQNNALLGCRYIRDVTAPAIVSFVLDLDEGYLLVTFSEPILPSSFQPSRINIQSSSGSLSPLTGGQVSARNTSIVLQIQLESTDLVHIYNGVTMSQPASSTMLQLSTGAFTDFSGNSLPSSTIAALEIVPDMTPPSLNNFTLNLIDGTVTLVFSEPVTIGNQQQFIGSLALTNNATSPSITLSNAQAPIQFEQSKPDTVILTLPPVLHQVLDSDLIATSVNDLHVVFLPTINVTDFTGFSLQPGVTQARGIGMLIKALLSILYCL